MDSVIPVKYSLFLLTYRLYRPIWFVDTKLYCRNTLPSKYTLGIAKCRVFSVGYGLLSCASCSARYASCSAINLACAAWAEAIFCSSSSWAEILRSTSFWAAETQISDAYVNHWWWHAMPRVLVFGE